MRRAKKILNDPTQVVAESLEGMVLASDLRLTDGRLLMARGTRLKMSAIETIRGLNGRGLVNRLIWICRQ